MDELNPRFFFLDDDHHDHDDDSFLFCWICTHILCVIFSYFPWLGTFLLLPLCFVIFLVLRKTVKKLVSVELLSIFGYYFPHLFYPTSSAQLTLPHNRLFYACTHHLISTHTQRDLNTRLNFLPFYPPDPTPLPVECVMCTYASILNRIPMQLLSYFWAAALLKYRDEAVKS